MNLKYIKLIVVFLSFLGITNAQNTNSFAVNIVNLDLIVQDDNNVQKVTLDSEPEINVYANHRVYLNFNLRYESTELKTRFFRFAYSKFDVDNDTSNTTSVVIDDPQHGITAPVIIPPVRKKNTIRTGDESEYPYDVASNFTPTHDRYRIRIFLIEYENRDDYLRAKKAKVILEPHEFYINVLPDDALILENVNTSFLKNTYPNPSTNHIVFEYPNTSDKNTIPKQLPLDVVIFNDKGVKMNQYSLTNTSSKTKSISYNLNISHLPKGRYYFQLSREGKTQVKIIQKE